MKKILWYLSKLFNLICVVVNLLVYFLVNPRKMPGFFFAIFTLINEFYEESHGQLKNFEETRAFKDICQNSIYVKSNVFNTDSKVTRPMETQILSALVHYFSPQTIFEIGTYNGFTTYHFAINSTPNCRIYTLDLPPGFNTDQLNGYSHDDLMVVKLSLEYTKNRIFHSYPEKDKIHELFGDSSRFDFSPYKGKMDLVFIDGNHSCDFVKSDTENALSMLSERGVIIWHDYDYIIHRDVFQYLNQFSKTHKVYSIPHTRFAIYGPQLA